jgi:quercetin dioxygenase-like cupin family protein
MPELPMVAPHLIPAEGDFVERLPGARWVVVPLVGATAVYWDFDAGATVPRHHHVHAQLVIGLEGSIDLVFDDKTVTVGPHEILPIAPWQYHAAEVKERVKLVDVFIPNREEYEAEYEAKRHA